jgi:hypothetical protein
MSLGRLWSTLEGIHPIVNTARVEDVERRPEAIRTRYEAYADAYFALESVERLQKKLITELSKGNAIVGYLSADYGYGKTATAAYLWKRCLDKDFISVPPFLFRYLRDIMQATKAWMSYQLRAKGSSFLEELDALYNQYALQSKEALTKQIADQHKIPDHKAHKIVEEYLAPRHDLTTTKDLLGFLEEATKLAKEAGLKGIVIYADEIQEFIRTNEDRSKESIQTLSELVKGIRSMWNVPLGLILCMPVNPTETAIEEQAGDIMHRMREHGTSLRLEDAYKRSFPSDLWNHLCRDSSSKYEVIESRTLEALGQLCERKDLSNGPRTLINALKRAVQHYRSKQKPYTPSDLIEDYLQGHIVFEGKGSKITNTLHRLLDTAVAKLSPQHQEAIKLLGAFPRGINQEIAGELYSLIEDIADRSQWLGEHITQLAEGYALTALQERPDKRPLLDEIIRKFRQRWHTTWERHTKWEKAMESFLQDVLPLIFPKRTSGQHSGFSWPKDSDHFNSFTYYLLKGSFERLSARFPERTILIAVTYAPHNFQRFQPLKDDVHLAFRFVLNFSAEEDHRVRIQTSNGDRSVDLYLNPNRTFGPKFPGELSFLQEIMLPSHTSASVILALSAYMREWLHIHPDISDSDRQLIESNRRILYRYASHLLFPNANDLQKVEVLGIKPSGSEKVLMESILERKYEELFPDYSPLMITREWKTTYLNRYRQALEKRPLAERRGIQPFSDTKDEIAKTFGWTHTAFDSNANKLQEMKLLRRNDWKGRGSDSKATVIFTMHPLENTILKILKDEGQLTHTSIKGQSKQVKSLSLSHLQKIAQQKGYLHEELEEVIQLLILRQHILRTQSDTIQEHPGFLDVRELSRQAQELERQINLIKEAFLETDNVKRYENLLHEAQKELTDTTNEIVLDKCHRQLTELESRLDEFLRQKYLENSNRLEKLIREIGIKRSDFQPTDLNVSISGTVEFVARVNDCRQELGKRYDNLLRKWDELSKRAQKAKSELPSISKSESVVQFIQEVVDIEKQIQIYQKELSQLNSHYLIGLQRWKEIVIKASALRDKIKHGHALRDTLDEELSYEALQLFAESRLDALLKWEHTKTKLDEIEGKYNAEESLHRTKFYNLKEEYEKHIGKLMGDRMLNAVFDPQESEKSYEVLHEIACEKLRAWLDQLEMSIRSIQSDLAYLTNERDIQLDGEQDLINEIQKDIQTSKDQLHSELMSEIEVFHTFCTKLGNLEHRKRQLIDLVNQRKFSKETPNEEEAKILENLSIRLISIEDIRRQVPDSMKDLDTLFRYLRDLYRKGHIEVQMRKRD